MIVLLRSHAVLHAAYDRHDDCSYVVCGSQAQITTTETAVVTVDRHTNHPYDWLNEEKYCVEITKLTFRALALRHSL